ncbi:hypothetical protein Isop_1890 [Isosphaera pallida ATCC 43644]|uniref:Uncharacterized protein n=1 Tax=Isosphaera pallida (strain ATCC 43644 / DSM 9630 / IS1B) TaxID=575540 RepID=E8R239_ISOPI|nr:hypothetical protein Isop_1890 [Isosphaera pallida ATCC 43644]
MTIRLIGLGTVLSLAFASTAQAQEFCSTPDTPSFLGCNGLRHPYPPDHWSGPRHRPSPPSFPKTYPLRHDLPRTDPLR